jgi:hypothetical protein
MECWNTGILGVRVKINYFNCKKLLQIHHSITPSFHYSNWGEALSSFLFAQYLSVYENSIIRLNN